MDHHRKGEFVEVRQFPNERTSRVDWVLVSRGFPRYRALPGNGRKLENSQNRGFPVAKSESVL